MAARIDHTILRPDATRADVEAACAFAVEHRCFSICVQPYWVESLAGHTPIPIVSTAGFPFGMEIPEAKAEAARRAVGNGASEIDIVVCIGAIKTGDFDAAARDVAGVRAAIPDAVLKVILEMGLLDRREAEQAARICIQEGADYLKTCTGYGPRGTTVTDVEILKPFGKVKASAGIRTLAQAEALLEAGADRLGASRTADILRG